MKNVLRLLILAAAVASFTLPATAQDTSTGAAAPSAQDEQAKADLYAQFLKLRPGSPAEQAQAYEVGKQYLGKYGNPTKEEDKKIVDYIRKWVNKYEQAKIEFDFNKAVAENPADAFRLSRDILAKNPDNLKMYLQLIQAGAKNSASGNKSLNADSANAARKALELVEQGKTTDSWAPLTSQQDAVAGLNYFIAYFTLDSAPEEAATHMLKVAQSNGGYSKEPSTYQLLGAAYYNGELTKLITQYKPFEGKDETAESKALLDKINVVLDRVIDAYARAVALSNNKPQYATINNAIKPALTKLYKQRHEDSEAGLQELIAGVLAKPIPIPGQEPVAPAAPSTSSGATGVNGAGTTPVGQPVANPVTPAPAAGTAPKPAATPTTTTAPASTTPKPKPIK